MHLRLIRMRSLDVVLRTRNQCHNLLLGSCLLRGFYSGCLQLIVDVAGLYACAPALEIIRPAGSAPFARAHANCVCHFWRSSSVSSTSESAFATRLYVAAMSLSTGWPSLSFRRYLVSQISSDLLYIFQNYFLRLFA